MAAADLTAARLRELLHYDPDTGVFTWIKSRSNRRTSGLETGPNLHRGYRRVRLDGHLYMAHRLAWLYVYGRWPQQCIDHINGVKSDNRIANLRDVSHSENLQNQRNLRSDNSSGFPGVSPAGAGRWQAHIKASGVHFFLGHFVHAGDAHAAYLEAKARLHISG